MYSMYALFGRTPDASRAPSYRKRHRAAGYAFLILLLLISYLCIDFAVGARVEPSPRASLHMLLAFVVTGLLIVKISFLRLFRQFYDQAKTMGTVIGILTFALVGVSAGYYLAVSRLGLDKTMDRSANYSFRGPLLEVKLTGLPSERIRTDSRSIERGLIMFESRCANCHDAHSARTIIGPGLQRILKNQKLPVSGHPATAESIRFQLKQPAGRMPSFAYLSPDEVDDLIAYLNTL